MLTLVIVPFGVLSFFAASIAVNHRDATQHASDSSHTVQTISNLVTLSEALRSEEALKAFDARFVELHVTTADASGFIGIDLSSGIEPARRRGRDALVALGADSPIPQGAVSDVDALIDAHSITDDAAARALANLDETVSRSIFQLVDQIDTTEGKGLESAVESLRDALTMDRVGTAEGVLLSTLTFPSATAMPQQATVTIADLAAAHATYESAAGRLQDARSGAIAATLAAVKDDSSVRSFESAVTSALRGDVVAQPSDSVDTALVRSVFRGFLDRGTRLTQLVATTTVAAQQEAEHERTSSQREFWEAIATGTALILVSLALVIFIAHAIARRLRELSDYARDLNDGLLDATAPTGRNRGPREARVAMSVIADLAETLRLIDAKTSALAETALDDPVLLEPLPGRVGESIERSVTRLSRSIEERDAAWHQSMERLARAVDLRDDDTGAHTQRVAAYCDVIARRLGVPAKRRAMIVAAAPMHDLGKIGVPDDILLKPGRLTASERAVIERHPRDGYNLLAGSGSELLELAATIALTHHERFDGTGYPHHLSGFDIPIEGRIAAVADVFDALTSARPYRPARTIDDALAIMTGERGTHFDPVVFDAFMHGLPAVLELLTRFHGTADRAAQAARELVRT